MNVLQLYKAIFSEEWRKGSWRTDQPNADRFDPFINTLASDETSNYSASDLCSPLMNMMIARELDENGRLQLPDKFLTHLGAEPGDWITLDWREDEQVVVLKMWQEDIGNSTVKVPSTLPQAFDTVAFIKESREERSDHIAGYGRDNEKK